MAWVIAKKSKVRTSNPENEFHEEPNYSPSNAAFGAKYAILL